jgi:prophage protein
MGQLAYQEARQQAQALLNSRAWDQQYPVKLLPFLDVANATLTEVVALGDNKVAGMIIKDNNAAAQIFINTTAPYPKQRETLAHELGHLVERELRDDQEYSFLDLREKTPTNLHEFYADEFACALLMPPEEFTKLQADGETIFSIAAYFNVTIDAVQYWRNRLASNPQ